MTKTGQFQSSISAIHWLETSGPLALVMFMLTVLGSTPAQAQTYTVLHQFKGSPTDGSSPSIERLAGGSPGDLFGSTDQGGNGFGVIFKQDKTGETVLHRFTGGLDGGNPTAGVIRDSAGNLYGTTQGGGASGWGVVFELDTTRKEKVLYNFTGGADGGQPRAGLVQDSAGNFYGTTEFGGTSGLGVVFKLDPTGTETVLHSFTYGADGDGPSRLTLDSAGNLYGTTTNGGASGAGVVFRLDTTGTETVLHSFTGGADGGNPISGVIRDSAGNLYGTTFGGGTCLVFGGCGVVFKLDTTGKETVLYSFTGGADGGSPTSGVIRDSAGNLYGTSCCGTAFIGGGGVVFKLDTSGMTVLYSFTGGADGGTPGTLVRDSAGNLYGTTVFGGISTGICAPMGCGVVFKLTP